MKRNYTIAAEGLTMIDGELRKVSFKSVTVKGDDVIYETKDGLILKNIVTYSSPGAFESDSRSETNIRVDGDYLINEDGLVELYTMKDGEPVSELLDVSGTRCRGYIVPDAPEGYYPSREVCLKNNTYIEVDEEGNKVEHIGVFKKFKLEDDQLKFIQEELEAVLKKAGEMGVRLIYNFSNEVLTACNTRHIKGNLWSDCCCESDGNYASSEHFYTVKESVLTSENEEAVWYDSAEL